MCQSYLIKDKLDKGMFLQKKKKNKLFWSAGILVKRISKTLHFGKSVLNQTLLKATPIFLLPSWIQLGHVNKRNLQLIRYLIDSVIVLLVVSTSRHY